MTGVSRRELLERATALVAGAAVLDRLPHALRVLGWLEDAYAATPNAVQQTMNGLVAFIVPGRDRYSTMQALATRTAEKIFVRYLGGDPWVGRESPVSSVDDTVTQAVIAAGL
jgi:hypothetical protein